MKRLVCKFFFGLSNENSVSLPLHYCLNVYYVEVRAHDGHCVGEYVSDEIFRGTKYRCGN